VDFSSIEALLIDMDGTIWTGDRLLPGVEELFTCLRRRGLPFLVATNNTQSPSEYREKMGSYGIDIEEEHIFTCTVTTESYLREHFPRGGRAYVIGKPALKQAVESAGFSLLPETGPGAGPGNASGRRPEQVADVVVVGGCFDLCYDHLKYASLHLQAGAFFIGSNPDLLIPTEEGLVPEAGTTLAALEAAAGLRPVILGKPEAYFFSHAVNNMGSHPSRTAIVGDRLETDILGAQKAGLKAVLVTTGVDSGEAIREKKIYPDAVIHGLRELTELLSAADQE
jgi:4-nitrophenyl phosphatase